MTGLCSTENKLYAGLQVNVSLPFKHGDLRTPTLTGLKPTVQDIGRACLLQPDRARGGPQYFPLHRNAPVAAWVHQRTVVFIIDSLGSSFAL